MPFESNFNYSSLCMHAFILHKWLGQWRSGGKVEMNAEGKERIPNFVLKMPETVNSAVVVKSSIQLPFSSPFIKSQGAKSLRMHDRNWRGGWLATCQEKSAKAHIVLWSSLGLYNTMHLSQIKLLCHISNIILMSNVWKEPLYPHGSSIRSKQELHFLFIFSFRHFTWFTAGIQLPNLLCLLRADLRYSYSYFCVPG